MNSDHMYNFPTEMLKNSNKLICITFENNEVYYVSICIMHLHNVHCVHES
jgi:hypothetical protein